MSSSSSKQKRREEREAEYDREYAERQVLESEIRERFAPIRAALEQIGIEYYDFEEYVKYIAGVS